MDYDYFDNVIDYDYDYIDFSSNVIDQDYDYVIVIVNMSTITITDCNYPMSDAQQLAHIYFNIYDAYNYQGNNYCLESSSLSMWMSDLH